MFGAGARLQQQVDDHVEECKRLREAIERKLGEIGRQLDQVLTEKDERVGAERERRAIHERERMSLAHKVSLACAVICSSGSLVVLVVQHLHWGP